MRSDRKKISERIDPFDWHEWYAWYPVRALVFEDEEYKNEYRWVWLDKVMRKRQVTLIGGECYALYRIYE